MLGGVLILLQGVVDVALAPNPPLAPPEPVLSIIRSVGGFVVVGAISILAGLLVIVGGWMISQKKKKNGSLLAILFALVGFAGGGGFILGTLLGLAGGVMNFRVME